MSESSFVSSDIYKFESTRRQFPDTSSEDAAVQEFSERLGFRGADYPDHRGLLLNFILNHHKVISRYKVLREKEQKRRYLFTGISLLLLFSIPALIFWLGNAAAGKEVFTAQMTALLTGLIAVHKSLSSWLDKRTVIGNFWKAESELKTKLYTFEDKWKGQATEAIDQNGNALIKLKIEFLRETQAAITEARAIVQNEQTKFFETTTYPSIDLLGLLKGTGDEAKQLVNAHLPPELQQQEKRRQAKDALLDKLAEQTDKVVALESEIAQRRQLVETNRASMAGASNEDIETLKSAISTQRSKLKQAEDEIVLARNQLAVLKQRLQS